LLIAPLKVVVSVLRKATVSVAVQIIHAPQTVTSAKVVSMTATAAVVSLHVVTLLPVAIQPLALTLPHAKSLLPAVNVVTSLRAKILLRVVISHLVATVQNVVTSPHVKISPLAVISLRAATLQTVNQHSQSLALPSQRLLSQLQNQATAAKCLSHVMWRKHALFALSNF
jgi:hypothetical protein